MRVLVRLRTCQSNDSFDTSNEGSMFRHEVDVIVRYFLREYMKEMCNLILGYLSCNYKLRMAYPHSCKTYIKMFVHLKLSNIANVSICAVMLVIQLCIFCVEGLSILVVHIWFLIKSLQ
jgi:hypothetical protein